MTVVKGKGAGARTAGAGGSTVENEKAATGRRGRLSRFTDLFSKSQGSKDSTSPTPERSGDAGFVTAVQTPMGFGDGTAETTTAEDGVLGPEEDGHGAPTATGSPTTVHILPFVFRWLISDANATLGTTTTSQPSLSQSPSQGFQPYHAAPTTSILSPNATAATGGIEPYTTSTVLAAPPVSQHGEIEPYAWEGYTQEEYEGKYYPTPDEWRGFEGVGPRLNFHPGLECFVGWS
jgi:hypothetical protein